MAKQKDFKENIQNYYDEFTSYDTFSKAVRALPGNYIGAIGNEGWKACIREIFQNSIDEMIKNESPCNYIKFSFYEDSQAACVIDNGRGIPHDHIEEIYTSYHMSTNFKETKKKGQYSSGAHGVGGGVSMALSNRMVIESSILGTTHRIIFHQGEVEEKEKEVKDSDATQGTSIFFTPDESIIGSTNLTSDEIFNNLVKRIFPLIPIGYTIDYNGYKRNGEVESYHLVNTLGIRGIIDSKIKNKPLINPIEFMDDNGTMKAHIVFSYDPSDNIGIEDVESFANYTPCGGYHLQGFLDGLTNFFMGYMNKIYLKNSKGNIVVNSNDIKSGLVGVVDAAHLYPVFEGQGKVALNNADIRVFISNLTKRSLEEWSKANTTDLNKLCKYFKEVAEIRTKLDNGRQKLSNQYSKSIINGDPIKYLKATGKTGLELYIVEGDSAYGSARSGRDHKTNALFPLRGKIINAFSTTKQNFFKNEEVASITKIITGLDHYDPNFDANKSRFDKIIFMTDGDADGAHIRSLLLRMFLLYFPDFIMKGKVYAAVPPLFGIKSGKSMKYFISNKDIADYTYKQFMSKHIIEDKNTGRRLNSNEIIKLFALNIDYNRILTIASDNTAVHKKLLEDVLIQIADDIEFTVRNTICMAGLSLSMVNEATLVGNIDNNVEFTLKKLDIKALEKRIRSKYRFMNIDIINGSIVIFGLYNEKIQNIVINPNFIKNCYEVIQLIAKNERMYFKVDGEVMSLYEVMEIANKALPGLKRYKGLGEQNPNELYESTMNPQYRTFIQYTMDSAKEEIDKIRIIDEDKSAIFKDLTITRQDIE